MIPRVSLRVAASAPAMSLRMRLAVPPAGSWRRLSQAAAALQQKAAAAEAASGKRAAADAAPPLGRPYAELTVGVPREAQAGERRVAQTPSSVAALCKAGFKVAVEAGAGRSANFRDSDYAAAGAQLVDRAAALGADIVCKVHPPTSGEVKRRLDEAEASLKGSLFLYSAH